MFMDNKIFCRDCEGDMIEHGKCDDQCCEFDKSMVHSPDPHTIILHLTLYYIMLYYKSSCIFYYLASYIILYYIINHCFSLSYCIIALVCYKVVDNYKLSL